MSSKARKYGIAIGAAGLCLGLAALLLKSRQTPAPPAARAPGQAVLADKASAQPAPTRAPRASPRVDRSYADYFNRTLMDKTAVKQLYDWLTARLPPGETSELAATFIAEGPVRNSDPDFVHFMSSMLADVRAHSAELYDLIRSQDDVLKQDPFVYQMTLNLAFQLQVPPEQKAEILGSAMGIHFQRDEKMGVTLMTANISNALILMKNSGVTLQQAMPYIQKGIETNHDDPSALKEFVARANAYYPGAVAAQ